MEHVVVDQDHSAELGKAIAACAGGDRRALNRIFELEAGRLIAVAGRIVKRRELAEEVVQDAFIRIWTHAHQYSSDRGSARGWIYAIVRNRALNVIRDGRREHTVGDIEALRETDLSHEVMASWHGLDQDNRLRACLGNLDEDKRRGILLAYVSGYSHGEIAAILRIPLGTTKSWIRRGLTSLRECLG